MRWGVAVLVLAAALVLGIAPLLLLAVSVFGLILPPRRPVVVLASAVLVALLLLPVLSADPFVSAVFGWTAALAGLFAALTLRAPGWPFTSRAVAAAAGSLAGFGGWLAVAGRWGTLDGAVGEQLGTLTAGWRDQLAAHIADPHAAEQFAAGLQRVTEWQVQVFPATLALHSLAVLAAAWWIFLRLNPQARWKGLAPVRAFRFNDQLVWIVVAGALLLLLPLGSSFARAGANLLLFMGGLYAVRGFAILAFMVRGTLPALLVTGGLLFAAFFNPFVLAVPLLVGLGDTWLDVRRRVAVVSRT